MYFGTRHLTFVNHTDEKLVDEHQELKTAYISTALDLIFAAPRFNNHRPYVMAGLAPALNLSTKANDYLQLKKSDLFFEVGMGCDIYLPYFKLNPELKFCFGLADILRKDRSDLIDGTLMKFTNSLDKARSKMIVLTIYFE